MKKQTSLISSFIGTVTAVSVLWALPLMERLHAENPKGGLVIQADITSKVEKVLAIMDAARNIGISQVAIAGENK